MGVMQCDRYGCPNILCVRLSPNYGYICDDCFAELVDAGAETNVGEFMGNLDYSRSPVDDLEFFKSLFPTPEEH